MDTAVDTDAPACEGQRVKVGVVFTGTAAEKDDGVISDDGRSVSYTSGKSKETKSFPFDQVVSTANMQSFHSELLQPLTDSIFRGYRGALLLCGVCTEEIYALIDHSIVKQLLVNLFGRVSSKAKGDLFISASFIQFYPDGSAVDLLCSNTHTLTLVSHPVFGSLVGGVCEVCVTSAEEAFCLYQTGRETLKTRAGSIYSRCSSLFSMAVEWKLPVEKEEDEEEEGVFSSRLQLFTLAGRASRTDLRGVSPLAKAVEQLPNGAPTADQMLPSLLHEALTGNSRSFLVYCINPQGLLDDDTPSALALAQKVRSLTTRASVGRWRPRETEREIRQKILDLQAVLITQGENGVHNTHMLAELSQNLQTVKKQSWERRREESEKIKVKTQQNRQTANGKEPSSDHTESNDTVKYLQEQLRVEMEEHVREGKGDVDKVQERIRRMQELKEALRVEMLKSRTVTEKSELCLQSQTEYDKAKEQMRQMKEDHGRLIQEMVEKMERDLAQEQLPMEGSERELLVLTRERQVLVMQMEALRIEAQQAERDLQDQYQRHQRELCCLREESLQVFRVFRQVSEEHRKMSADRYRRVLLDAVQDAVYLSAQNQQLQADNKQLHKALGKLKDSQAVSVHSEAEQPSQQ